MQELREMVHGHRRLSQLLYEMGAGSIRLQRVRFTAMVLGISVIYKLMENSRFMSPIISPLNETIGSGTLIEVLLGVLIIYLLLEKNAARDKTTTQGSIGRQAQRLPDSSMMVSFIDAIWRNPHSEGGIRPESQPRPIPVRRRTLNIVAKKARIAWLTETGNFFYEPEEIGKLKAIIAEFRNEPGEFSVINWHHVRASIAYHDERGSEIADVGRAAWLDEIGSVIDLPSHVTRKLIVAIQTANGAWIAVDGASGNAKALSPDIRRARITLHDNRQFSLSYSLVVHLNQGVLGSLLVSARRD